MSAPRFPYRPLLLCLLALCGWCASACTDAYEQQGAADAESGQGTLRLYVPNTRSIPQQTAPESDEPHTTAEGRITSLWFLAYPNAEGGEAMVAKLPCNQLESGKHAVYNLKLSLNPATGRAGYKIYVVANVPQVHEGITEEELKQIILQYCEGEGTDMAPVLPSPDSETGLPMLYKSPQDISLQYNQTGTTVYADLVFTCVKVTYTILFNKDTDNGTADAFGTHNVVLKSISAHNIAATAPLVLQQPEEHTLVPGKAVCGGSLAENSTSTQWSYTGTVYLPEHYVTKATQQNQTELHIEAALTDREGNEISPLKYTIELGDTNGQTGGTSGEEASVRNMPRGTHYDITGRIKGLGEKLELTVEPEEWDLSTLNAQLHGSYYLWVERTESQITSGDIITIPYDTDAPTLDFESGEVTLIIDGKEETHPLFVMGQDEKAKTFSIEVNPAIPINELKEQLPEGYESFVYVVAGNLKKKITLNPVKAEIYLEVTPPSYTIYIKDIPNHQTEYSVEYIYRTNLPYVAVKPLNNYDHLKEENSGLTRGKGTLTATLENPHHVGNFSSTLTKSYLFIGYHDYEDYLTEDVNKGVIVRTTTLTIIPNTQSYRLHFRPIDDKWTSPHIYVYEPLSAPDGTAIKITGGYNLYFDGEYKDFYSTYGGTVFLGEDALLYSYTGKRTFLGWQSQGGSVREPQAYYEPNGEHYWDGEYGIGNGTKSLKYLQYDDEAVMVSAYNWNIDYAEEFRDEALCKDCCISTPKGHNSLSGTSPAGYNYKWPGVSMRPDKENPGWFYYDLPALAQPGQTLIMFAEGHNGPTSDDANWRYPAHMVPGVPLYNFQDKDGWFLYDPESSTNEFVDDKPGIPDLESAKLNGKKLRIWNDSYPTYSYIYVWRQESASAPSADKEYTAKWPGDTLPSERYFDFDADWSNYPAYLGVIFNDGGTNKTTNIYISLDQWKEVEGKDYDYEVHL